MHQTTEYLSTLPDMSRQKATGDLVLNCGEVYFAKRSDLSNEVLFS